MKKYHMKYTFSVYEKTDEAFYELIKRRTLISWDL